MSGCLTAQCLGQQVQLRPAGVASTGQLVLCGEAVAVMAAVYVMVVAVLMLVVVLVVIVAW